MTQRSLSPLEPIKRGISVDDLFEWVGKPRMDAYNALAIGASFTSEFGGHGVKDVDAFSNTAPGGDDPTLYRVFDCWTEQGHHTHNHASPSRRLAQPNFADFG